MADMVFLLLNPYVLFPIFLKKVSLIEIHCLFKIFVSMFETTLGLCCNTQAAWVVASHAEHRLQRHRLLVAHGLECPVACGFSSQPKDRTHVTHHCGWILNHCSTRGSPHCSFAILLLYSGKYTQFPEYSNKRTSPVF